MEREIVAFILGGILVWIFGRIARAKAPELGIEGLPPGFSFKQKTKPMLRKPRIQSDEKAVLQEEKEADRRPGKWGEP